MTRRDEVEVALRELVRLLDAQLDSEAEFQRFFESHTVAWEALHYIRALPQPQLHSDDGRLLIPDFLAERIDGVADVVDLKTPGMRLIVQENSPRSKQSAKLTEAIVQLEDYSRVFGTAAGREQAEDLGMRVPSDPTLVLIAGYEADPAELQAIAARFSCPFRIYTYDVVERSLLIRHAQEFPLPAGTLSYYAFALMFAPLRLPGTGQAYLLDHGLSPEHDRVSILLDSAGGLHVRVLTSDGKLIPLGSQPCVTTEEWCFLLCELYLTNIRTVIEVRVDGVLAARYDVTHPITLSSNLLRGSFVVSADMLGEHGAAIRIGNYMIFDEPPDVLDRMRLWNWAADQIQQIRTRAHLMAEEHQYVQGPGS